MRRTAVSAMLCLFILAWSLSGHGAMLAVTAVNGNTGAPATAEVTVDDAKGVAGYQLTITYDTGELQCTGTQPGNLTAGWIKSQNLTVSGQAVIAGADSTLTGLAGGSGSLVKLLCTITGNSGPANLCITSHKLVDSSGREIPSAVNACGFPPAQDTSPGNPCATTVSEGLALHIPILTFNGQAYWADFRYLPGTSDFELTAAGALTDLSAFSACSPATLSLDLRLYIPIISLGEAYYWASFEYRYGAVVTLTAAGENR